MSKFSFEQRIKYIEKYGSDTLSVSTLQPKMRYFDLENIGYIAFRKKLGVVFCLSDPVCDPKLRVVLLEAFLKQFPNAVFVEVSPEFADEIRHLTDFYATQFGIKTTVNFQEWSLSGKKKKVIRKAINSFEKQGITIKETSSYSDTQKLSESWIQTRKCNLREIVFLSRPIQMDYKKDIRTFIAYKNDDPIGLVIFDPIYKNNKIIGYTPMISRASTNFSQGIFYVLIVKAMETFKKEDVHFAYLGLSPLALNYPKQPFESTILRSGLWFTARYMSFLYNFEGIKFTKSRFCGKETPTYIVHKNRAPFKSMLALMLLTRIL